MADQITVGLLAGYTVGEARLGQPLKILKPIPPTMTIADLFKGQEHALTRIVQELAKGRLARDVAEELVEPILSHLEVNAGTALDPTYLVYMVQYASQQTGNPKSH